MKSFQARTLGDFKLDLSLGPQHLVLAFETRKATRNQHEKDFVSALWWKLEDGLSHGGPVSKTAVKILPEEMA